MLERREEYMAALESATVGQDVKPFAAFLAGLVKDRLRDKNAARLPEAGSIS